MMQPIAHNQYFFLFRTKIYIWNRIIILIEKRNLETF